MNKTEQRTYLTPQIEVIQLTVEQGFNGSIGGENHDGIKMLQSIDATENTTIEW